MHLFSLWESWGSLRLDRSLDVPGMDDMFVQKSKHYHVLVEIASADFLWPKTFYSLAKRLKQELDLTLDQLIHGLNSQASEWYFELMLLNVVDLNPLQCMFFCFFSIISDVKWKDRY